RLLAEFFTAAAHAFQMSVHSRTGGYGNLILSRWPMRAHHHVSLRLGRRKPRGAQLAIVDTPEGLLQVANWHLGLAEAERWWQVDHLMRHALFRESADLPTLIVGDFNDWRNNLAAVLLAEHQFEHVTGP